MAVSNVKINSPLAQLLKEPGAVVVAKKGELLNAVFIYKDRRSYYFDLGRYGTGILYGLELLNAQDNVKQLKPGGAVLAKVVESENETGYVELSLSETSKHKAWQEIKELQERGEIVAVKISNANTGGLIAEISEVKAFLPVSQLAADHYPRVPDGDRAKILEELKKFIGQELKVKIIDLNPRTNKLIISEREILEDNVKEKLAKYQIGQVVNVIVSGIADFGVFVKFADEPTVEGLIHISELDHRLIENPREVVKIDELVQAKILEIKDGRVSLSLKALKENPWEKVMERYQEGQSVTGSVSRLTPFGAFIKLDQDFQGIIRVSDFGGVEEMKKQLTAEEQYQFIIESIKPAEKRIILKLKS